MGIHDLATYQGASIMRLKSDILFYSSSLAKVQMFEAAGSSQFLSTSKKDKSHHLHFHFDGFPVLFNGNKSTYLKNVDSALRA